MHDLAGLPAWERLLKKIVWKQLGDIQGKYILDFGSGEGITANHLAAHNRLVAVEPSEAMLAERWIDFAYEQIHGDAARLSEFADNTFDMVICHNVLEYIDNKQQVLAELCRILKPNGMLSIVKHNRAGRVMQMAVLLDDLEKTNALLDGQNSTASKFGVIRYYENEQISAWVPALKLASFFGIRTFWDLQQNQEKHASEEWQDRMLQLELRVSQMDAYREIAFFHHLLFTKEM